MTLVKHIKKLSDIYLQIATKVCTGELITSFDKRNINFSQPQPEVLSLPTTEWAKKVDKLHEMYARDYDDKEYRNNPTLSFMGYAEIMIMLKAFGVSLDKQANYEESPFKGKKFLVVGAGTGREVVAIAGLGGEVVGIDASYTSLLITTKKVQKAANQLNHILPVKLYQCLAEKYPYGEQELDGVSSLFGVINHIELWRETLEKMPQSLKVGGTLVLSMYGSKNALVFRLLKEGKLPYKPALVQRRVAGGIHIGGTKSISPAHFPTQTKIMNTLKHAGLEPIQKIGLLRFAGLFPQDVTPKNITAFKSIIYGLDKKLGMMLQAIESPEDILRVTFLYDLENQSRTNDFAYVAFVAQKKRDFRK